MFESTASVPTNKILKRNLKFFDEVLEEEFMKKKEVYQKRIFTYYLISILCLSTVIWFTSKYFLKTWTIIFNCSKSLMPLGYWIGLKRYPRGIENIITVILVPLQIGILINSVEYENENSDKIFFNGLIFEFFSLTPIFIKLSWIRQTLLLLSINLSLSLKSFTSQTGFRNIMLLVGNFLVLILIGYIIEKYERLFFFENKRAERSLRFFEKFISRSIPLGVLVVEKNEVIFNNSESLKLLAIENRNKIELSDLNKVTINDLSNNENLTLVDVLNEKYGEIMSDHSFHSLKGDYLNEEFCKYKASLLVTRDNKFTSHLFNVSVNRMIWRNYAGVIILLGEDLDGLKIETMKKYDEYKNNVLASISHQLRTPLNGVMGILESLSLSAFEKSTKEALDIALRSSQRLLSFINNIIDLGQFNTGGFSLDIEEFFIEDVIKEIADYTQMESSRKKIAFFLENRTKTSNTSQGCSKRIFYNDHQRLRQVLLNFLNNCIKFTDQGFIKLSYEFIEEPLQKEATVFFSIEDTGSGISESKLNILSKVFEKLEFDEIKELNQHGMGLGLAITHKLLWFMNSPDTNSKKHHISIKSSLGKGSIFEFFVRSMVPNTFYFETDGFEERGLKDFDLNVNINMHNLQKSNDFKNNNSSFPDIILDKRKRILVVDDDPVNLLVIGKFLDSFAKFDYICVDNGLKGVNLIKSKREQHFFFDLVLMDCNMPVMDGFTATNEILKLMDKKLIPYLPIVAVTANVLQVELEKCLECGMIDYLTKPLTRERLLEKINKFI